MLAAERYRLAHGRWPAALSDLVPDYLAQLPLDPYDGMPLKLRRMMNGIVIYTVGEDGKDDGGDVMPHWRDFGQKLAPDTGLRLWDVNQRRQPHRPPTKDTGH